MSNFMLKMPRDVVKSVNSDVSRVQMVKKQQKWSQIVYFLQC